MMNWNGSWHSIPAGRLQNGNNTYWIRTFMGTDRVCPLYTLFWRNNDAN